MRCGDKNCIVAFPVKQRLGERTTMFQYTYIASIVFFAYEQAYQFRCVELEVPGFWSRSMELLYVTVLAPRI